MYQVVAEAKLCFSCLRVKHTFRQCKVPVNIEKMVATAPITPYFTKLKGFFQLNLQQTTTSIIRSQNAGTSRPPTGQKQPSKTTTLSYVTDVKGPLRVWELKLTNFSGDNTMAFGFMRHRLQYLLGVR